MAKPITYSPVSNRAQQPTTPAVLPAAKAESPKSVKDYVVNLLQSDSGTDPKNTQECHQRAENICIAAKGKKYSVWEKYLVRPLLIIPPIGFIALAIFNLVIYCKGMKMYNKLAEKAINRKEVEKVTSELEKKLPKQNNLVTTSIDQKDREIISKLTELPHEIAKKAISTLNSSNRLLKENDPIGSRAITILKNTKSENKELEIELLEKALSLYLGSTDKGSTDKEKEAGTLLIDLLEKCKDTVETYLIQLKEITKSGNVNEILKNLKTFKNRFI
jgi:hypothetical protein